MQTRPDRSVTDQAPHRLGQKTSRAIMRLRRKKWAELTPRLLPTATTGVASAASLTDGDKQLNFLGEVNLI